MIDAALLAGAVALALAKGKSVIPNNVRQRENAGSLLAPLRDFLTWWELEGPHSILIPQWGGMREGIEAEAWQRKQYDIGTSRALSLRETPHGRGAALDLWPVEFDYYTPWDKQPTNVVAKFKLQGVIAKEFGFKWGGDWGWDYPHIEIPNWRTLPFPMLKVNS